MCDDCIAICSAIGELNTEEGNGVNILAANPDFIGPSYAIEATGAWTNWVTVRFEGDSLREALERAVKAKRELGSEPSAMIQVTQRPPLKRQREAIIAEIEALCRSYTVPGTNQIEPPEMLEQLRALQAAAATLEALPGILKRITDAAAALTASSAAYDRGCDHIREGHADLVLLVAGVGICPDCKGDGDGAASLAGAALTCPTCKGTGSAALSGEQP